MECSFFTIIEKKSYCKIAKELSGVDCETMDSICTQCSQSQLPKQPNEVTAGLALLHVNKQQPEKAKELLTVLYPLLKSVKITTIGNGPGSELKQLLSWFAVDTPDCECLSRARLMNVWGPQGCRNNIVTILGWLKEEAGKRNLPYIEMVARALVNKAISRAEQCILKNASSST